MTQAAHDGYQLPDGFGHCSKLRPVVEATSASSRVRAVEDEIVRLEHDLA